MVINRFLPQDIRLDDIVKAMVAMALFAAAYLAENVRGGLQSIPKGQREAAQAVGLSTVQMTVLITLPQALRAVIPAIVGQVITLFKDTSLVAIIGLADFLRIAQAVVPNQPASLGSMQESLLFAVVVYWIFSFGTSRASMRLEKKLGVGER
ncbi:MAG TPA: ABC transporter permease subunit [Actinobacteria bacterium]|nr:ABC transporter permease subunit [Actinomycetota bacterium]